MALAYRLYFCHMIQIHLEDLSFYAYHGLYKEERLLGNYFIVDIKIEYQPTQKIINNIHETIDYTVLYDLISKRMKIPTELLETIATEFCYQVMEQFNTVQSVQFKIKKQHPPIHELNGNIGVSFSLERTSL